MYVVRNRKSKAVIHVNHAPLSQELSGKEVYFKFNPNSMWRTGVGFWRAAGQGVGSQRRGLFGYRRGALLL